MAHLYSSEYGAADAVLLPEVSEDAFVNNLQLRYNKERIYTYIGEVLINVNPYRDLGLYTEEKLRSFRNKALYQNEPHVYALAEAAYSTMRRTNKDCVVIISGESGAGKTEASKHVMRYVAAVNSTTAQAEILRVRNQLLASNPLLEAFGNAKTVRNDNSSRFGKYMDINFDFKTEPVGGHISNYLLEKGRVVHQNSGERNFHIFYQILAGADDATLSRLKLTRDASAYKFLSQGAVAADAAADKVAYLETKKAMQDIGFSAETESMLHNIVAAVLHLGQIEFQAQGDTCTVRNPDAAKTVADLLGAKADDLSKALTTRIVAARGEIYETKLSADAAASALHALAKSLYEKLFSHLVTLINDSIAPKTQAANHVVLGVLDIYGFEIFPNNSFEQFCINYCNEKLQQVFIELVLKLEQEEYKTEGIDWVNIEYFNNAEICTMIEDPKSGIIAMLDEQCAMASGSDAALLSLLDRQLKSQPRYSSLQKDTSDKLCVRDRDFRIRHFAGDVVYNTTGFVEKNNDTLFHDLKRMLYNCNNAALKAMWPEGADALTEVHKMPYTAATNFRRSMDELVAMLKMKEPFYIRCIKPNNNKAAKQWDEQLCHHQVAYLGLMENLRVRRAGYCNRQPYAVFLDRYKMLCKDTWPHWHKAPKDGVRKITDQLQLDEEVAFGKTKLFIKDPKTLVRLEEEREAMIPKLVAKIQAYYRGVLARRRVRKIRAVYRIVAFWHKCHMRKYVNTLCQVFSGVTQSADLGKSVVFPPAPPGTNAFAVLCKRLHSAWRAQQIMKRFTPEQQAELKQKILASEMLGGRRPFWGYHCKWEGNYLAKGSNAAKFGAAVGPLLEKNGDAKVIFSSQVYKLNTKGKQDERVLVVTDKNLYRLDAKSWKAHKAPTPLTAVSGFSMSAGEDQALIVHIHDDNDWVLTLRGNACAAELASLIAQAVGKMLPVKVDNKVHYQAAGKEVSLKFSQEDASKTTFTRKGSGYALITRKASLMKFQPPVVSGASQGRLNQIAE